MRKRNLWHTLLRGQFGNTYENGKCTLFLHGAIPLVRKGLTCVCTHIHTCVGSNALLSIVYGGERLRTTSMSSVRDGGDQSPVHPCRGLLRKQVRPRQPSVRKNLMQHLNEKKKVRGITLSRACFTCVENEEEK